MKSIWPLRLGIALLGLCVFTPGLPWGLPSKERAELVLPEIQRTPQLLSEIAAARQTIYDRSGGNPNAELGRNLAKGISLYRSSFEVPRDLLLLSYSSFLVRSMDPDEQRTLAALAQMNPRRLQLNPHYFVYGGLYIYSLGAWLELCRLARAIHLVSDVTHYYNHPEDMRAIYLAGRVFTVFLGIAALLAFFEICRRNFGQTTAAASAVLAALTPAVIAQAHLMKPHLPGCLPALLCVGVCLNILRGDSKAAMKSYLLAGLLAGTAMSFNPIFASFCGLAILFAQAMSVQPSPWARRWIQPEFWAALIIMAATYLITNPYAILSFSEFRLEIMGYQLGSYRLGGLMNALNYWRYPLRGGVGNVLWLAQWPALAALFAWGTRADRYLALLFLAGGAYCGAQLGAPAVTPELVRYFLPGLWILAVIECRGGAVLADQLNLPSLSAVWAVFLILAAAPASAQTLNFFTRESSDQSNGLQAGLWIKNNLPENSSVAIISPMPHIYIEPPFPFGRYRLFSLRALENDPSSHSKSLPPYAVWGAYYGTFLRGDIKSYEDSFLKLGYRRWHEFEGPGQGKNFLTTASMPFFIYRRSDK
jgi:hypothetical protein